MVSKDFPDFIKISNFDKSKYINTLNIITSHNLNTVCVEANCPNRYECFSKKTATFMILGNICTRNCLYCNIKKGKPLPVDKEEPKRIAKAVKALGLNHAVITCVTRDDLEDNGSNQFIRTVHEIKKTNPKCKVEILISDLRGEWNCLKKIIESGPDIINHNIEVVKTLFPKLRPKGSFKRSIELLKKAKEFGNKKKIKSGIMIGLGETDEQIIKTFHELKDAGCDILTIGQYLQPSENHAEVKKYYKPDEFNMLKKKAESIGFKKVESGTLVRSSYRAGDVWKQ